VAVGWAGGRAEQAALVMGRRSRCAGRVGQGALGRPRWLWGRRSRWAGRAGQAALGRPRWAGRAGQACWLWAGGRSRRPLQCERTGCARGPGSALAPGRTGTGLCGAGQLADEGGARSGGPALAWVNRPVRGFGSGLALAHRHWPGRTDLLVDLGRGSLWRTGTGLGGPICSWTWVGARSGAPALTWPDRSARGPGVGRPPSPDRHCSHQRTVGRSGPTGGARG
jgi:hypothetical protein